jgi:hypothetical protein
MTIVLLQMALSMLTVVLKEVIKNPSSMKTEGTIIADAALLATEADTAVNGTVWTSTSATSPTPAVRG